ncbi:hypothetical protein ABIB40_004002 [Pedobacter sp. UYP30]
MDFFRRVRDVSFYKAKISCADKLAGAQFLTIRRHRFSMELQFDAEKKSKKISDSNLFYKHLFYSALHSLVSHGVNIV